jgi:hypothetical protein
MWIVENFRPFNPIYGRGKHFRTGTKFVWQVSDVLYGGKILFRFTTIDGKHNCLVTMKELDNFVEVSPEVLKKLLEEFRKQQQDKREGDLDPDNPSK